MKSRSEIWLRALEELGAQCSVSTTRDAVTLTRRVAQEGESFFTITLPQFGKDFERSLRSYGIPSDSFVGWKRGDCVTTISDRRNGLDIYDHRLKGKGTPKFLGGFLDLVFDTETRISTSFFELEEHSSIEDVTMSEPRLKMQFDTTSTLERHVAAVAALRQLTLMFSKEFRLAPPAKELAAIQQYVATDKELDNPLADARAATLFEGRLGRIRKVITLCFGEALSTVDQEIFNGSLIPKHGSGATADGLRGNQKWQLQTWHNRLEKLFPYGDYAIPNWKYYWRLDQVEFLEPEDEPPVKLVAVPKTQRTPRLIAEEPTCMMFVQQAIMRSLVTNLELPWINGQENLSKYFVGFREQWPNQVMARIGSEDGSLATLDLSEASDRIPNWLVEDLFSDFPWFLEGIQACRSTKSKLPSGEVIDLLKFASMGSALTFPIEAVIFAAASIERVLSATGKSVTRQSIKALRDSVRVYGDDIIVPTDTAVSVIDGLETLGFVVNHAKSFWTGEFRESCGKEYYKGFDVSIVKIRQSIPSSQRDVTEILATVSTRNQFYMAGMWQTAALLDDVLVKVLNGRYPIVLEESPVLGRTSVAFEYETHKLHPDTQSPLVRGWVESSKSPINGLDEIPALTKCLLSLEFQDVSLPKAAEEHLVRSGRPRAVSIKRAMASPF